MTAMTPADLDNLTALAEGATAGPPSDLLTGDDIAAFAISGDHDTRNDNDGPGRARV